MEAVRTLFSKFVETVNTVYQGIISMYFGNLSFDNPVALPGFVDYRYWLHIFDWMLALGLYTLG